MPDSPLDRLEGLWSPVAPPDDIVTEDEQRRVDRERIDPDGMLTPRQLDQILRHEEDDELFNEAFTPQEGDDLPTKLALARARWEASPDVRWAFPDCVDCGLRLVYYGPATTYDPTTARCARCTSEATTPDGEE